MRSSTFLALFAVAGAVFSQPVPAVVAQAPALADAHTLTCTFSAAAAGAWTTVGRPLMEAKAASLTLTFDQIDLQEGSAHVTGGYVANDIVARLAGTTLHFLNVGSSGPIAITTVFDSPASAGKLKAVHSRHDYVESSLPGFAARPEQYYGECEAPRAKNGLARR